MNRIVSCQSFIGRLLYGPVEQGPDVDDVMPDGGVFDTPLFLRVDELLYICAGDLSEDLGGTEERDNDTLEVKAECM